MKNVSRDVILSLPFPLPPLAEQQRIVAKVEALMALCERLEASLTATAATRRRLLDATAGRGPGAGRGSRTGGGRMNFRVLDALPILIGRYGQAINNWGTRGIRE